MAAGSLMLARPAHCRKPADRAGIVHCAKASALRQRRGTIERMAPTTGNGMARRKDVRIAHLANLDRWAGLCGENTLRWIVVGGGLANSPCARISSNFAGDIDTALEGRPWHRHPTGTASALACRRHSAGAAWAMEKVRGGARLRRNTRQEYDETN